MSQYYKVGIGTGVEIEVGIKKNEWQLRAALTAFQIEMQENKNMRRFVGYCTICTILKT